MMWRLLLGAGKRRAGFDGVTPLPEEGLVTLDANRVHVPNVVFDLDGCISSHPLPDLSQRTYWIHENEVERLSPILAPSALEPNPHPWLMGRGLARLPFLSDSFDEIHAYEVLEHIGRQGDHLKFFAQFTEFWRVMKPGGLMYATVPHWQGLWAWGDPSHSRIISRGTLTFLHQPAYVQVGQTAMSDYRNIYKADFTLRDEVEIGGEQYGFVLEAVKPARIVP
jgi:Methyltransferase domain